VTLFGITVILSSTATICDATDAEESMALGEPVELMGAFKGPGSAHNSNEQSNNKGEIFFNIEIHSCDLTDKLIGLI
jgi:hypothetical protein